MKIDKKKVVFFAGITLVVMAMIGYWMMLQKDSAPEVEQDHPEVPALKEEPMEYESRLEAVDHLKEERERHIPSVYDERFLDSSGSFDPYLEEHEKNRLVDSILASGPEPSSLEQLYTAERNEEKELVDPSGPGEVEETMELPVHLHQEFFLMDKKQAKAKAPTKGILAMVDGDQVVQKDERLILRLLEPVVFDKDTIPAHSRFYARCDFMENRLLLEIYSPVNHDVQWEAYDLADGQPGIYVPNSFRAEATTEVLDDVLQDINISGVPQVRGLKALFQRSNRRVKIKISHQYQLILKPVL